MTYWARIFTPIAHKQLKEKYGYDVVYVDSMAGSGVTKTQRVGDYFCGSCPGAILYAINDGIPFDKVIGVEIDKKKSNVLSKRLTSIRSEMEISIYSKDILEVSNQIADELKSKTIAYIVIDPKGFKGMTWGGNKPTFEL